MLLIRANMPSHLGTISTKTRANNEKMYKLSKITEPQPSDRRDQCDDAGLADYRSNAFVGTIEQNPPEEPRRHKRDHSPKQSHHRRKDEKHTSHRKHGHHHHHHQRAHSITDEEVAKKEQNKHSRVGNKDVPRQSERLVTSEAFLMQHRTQQEEAKARAKDKGIHKQHPKTRDAVHPTPEEETRTAHNPMSPISSIRPGAFREGGSDGSDPDLSLHDGDIEQGIVPPSFHEPTIEAHVVDEALEQERYDRLYDDLEKVRGELSAANKEPVMVSATRLKSCKERIYSLFFNRQFVFLVGGCVALAMVISTMVKRTEPLPPVALPHLLPFLNSISPDGGVALSDMNTPQFRAATWLAGNTDLANMSNRTKIQRYALATLYYSTGGDQWFTNYKWLTDSNECEWYNTKWSKGWESNSSGIRMFCSNEDDGDLEMIFLQGNNLHGQVPLELSLLSNSLGKHSLYYLEFVRLDCCAQILVLCLQLCSTSGSSRGLLKRYLSRSTFTPVFTT
jgi:hypothetical protein